MSYGSLENTAGVPGPFLNFTYSRPPDFNSRTPNDGASVPLQPVLSARFIDPDGDSGRIRFRVYNSTGATLLGTYDGPVVASGQLSSVTVPSGLLSYNASYRWTAQAIESGSAGLSSPESNTRLMHTAVVNPVAGLVGASASEAAAGMPVTVTATLTNSNSVAVTASFTGTLPAGWTVIPGSTRLDGASCGACTTTTSSVAVSGLAFPASSTRTLTFVIQPLRSLLECAAGNLSWTVTTTAVAATSSGNTPLSGCGTGLGFEPWWSYEARPLGPQATASVNAANGNLVVQHLDSTPVQGHGDLAFVLRRTYNSHAPETLPIAGGGLGQGWTLNVTDAGDLAGVTSGSGLLVPSITDATVTAAVTLIDRDGTRHLFQPGTTSVDVQLSSPLLDLLSQADITPTSVLRGLADAVARANAGTLDLASLKVCVDTTYTAPPGVHLSLWRYVAVSAGASCVGAGPASNPVGVVLGYGTMRPDRVRQVFDITGRLQAMFDASGNELRYRYNTLGQLADVYEPAACPDPAVSTCRTFRFSYTSTATTVTDPSGRAVKYTITNNQLTQVTTTAARSLPGLPDTLETWNYDTTSNCGQPSGTAQLCGVQAPNGAWTRFTYANETRPRVTSIAERYSASDPAGPSQADLTTTFAYTGRPSVRTDATRAHKVVRYDAIDANGRVAERYDGTDTQLAAGTATRRTSFVWDVAANGPQPAVTCRPVDNQVDNNLCRVTRYTGTVSASGAPPGWVTAGDSVTEFAYTPEGAALFERSALSGGWLTTTWAYKTTYTRPDGTTVAVDDTITGPGTHTSTVRPTGALFAVTDRVAERTPRGNTTTWTIDRDPTKRVGVVGSGGGCGTGNSGLACREDRPEAVTTTYQYETHGQLSSKRTPKANAEGGAAYTYTYYADTDLDQSGNVTAGGWLKLVTDPTGAFVAFAYDRAGNTVRTWDRDATAGKLPAEFPGTPTAAPGKAHTVVYNWGVYADAVSSPWRWVITDTDPLGNFSTTTRDAHGNPIRVRPPRGTAGAGTAAYDTTQTFTVRDQLSARQLPLSGPWQWRYDEAGNLTATIDPNSQVRTAVYDAANRKIEERFTRGGWAERTSALESSCRQSTGSDAPLPAGRILCFTAITYDGADRQVAVRDAAGALAWTTFDQTGRPTDTYVPRATGVWRHAVKIYDADGNVLFDCGPRQAAEEPSVACGAGAHYSTANTFDDLGRLDTVTRYRQTVDSIGQYNNGWVTLTTAFGYDADSNQTSVRDPNGRLSTATFDLLDRKKSQAVPRDASTTVTTEWDYSRSGDLTAVVVAPATADEAITAYTYDAAHRPVDTVSGSTVRAITVDNPGPAASGPNDTVRQNTRTRTLYDSEGRVVGIYSPRAFTTSVTAPDTRFLTQIDYDRNGRPIAQWQPAYDLVDQNFQPGLDEAILSECPVKGIDHNPATGTGTPGYGQTVGLCVTRVSYDSVGNVRTVRNPAGARITTLGAGADNADHPETPNIYQSPNRYVEYRYTNDNLVAEIIAPNPAPAGGRVRATLNRYDGNGRSTLTVDAADYETLTTWTADGLTAATEGRAAGASTVEHQVTYTYNHDGQTLDTNTRINTTRTDTATTDYYSDGSVHQINDGAGTGTPNLRTRYSYDNNGNTTTMWSPSAVAADATNPNGKPTINTYSHDNLLLTATQPVNPTATLQRRTSYGYDQRGNQTAVNTAEVNGSGVVLTDAGTQTTTYNDDNSIRAEIGRAPGGGRIDHYWLPDGAPHKIINTSPAGITTTTTTTYWLDGPRRNSITLSSAAGFKGTSEQFTHHADGTEEQRRSYDGFILDARHTFSYNDARLLTGVNATGGGQANDTWTVAYDRAGRPAQLTDPLASVTTYNFNADSTLESRALHQTTATSTTLARWEYTYDGANRILTQKNPIAVGASGGTANTKPFTYDYDAAGRLTSFNDGVTTRTVGYDANSNRTTDGTATYHYRLDNTIADQDPDGAGPNPAVAFTYDAAGRLTQEPCRTNPDLSVGGR